MTTSSELAIVFSDAHVHKHKQFNENNRRLTNGIALIDKVFAFAHRNNIKYILFAGDMYDQMNIVATEASTAILSCFKTNFERYSDIHFIAISGNHDQAFKNLYDTPAETALRHLTIFDNFHLLDNEGRFKTSLGACIEGIPYYEYPEDFKKRLQEIGDDLPCRRILLTHQVIASGLPIEDHIEPVDPLFSPFDMIFNGHLHTPQEVTDKFVNVGSPMHRDASDTGQRKGIWVVDLLDPVSGLNFIDITSWFPQFIYKIQGSVLTDWDKEQYVVWVPEPIITKEDDRKIVEEFSTTVAPVDIIKSYCEAVCSKKELQAKLSYGLSL